MATKTSLYDVLSKLNPPQWSSNTLRTRLALNFLQIPYETVFLSYPDIEPTFSAFGLQPSNSPPYDSQPKYTVPVIKDGDTWVSGAFNIATYLAKEYPPSATRKALFPQDSIPLAKSIIEFLDAKILTHVRKIVLPRVPTWLDDRGAAYFRETRKKWLGKPLEEYFQSPEEVTANRANAVEGLKELAKKLDEHPEGPFVLGVEPSYADLNIVAMLLWIRRGDEATFKQAMSEPAIEKLWDTCLEWH